MCTDQGTKKAPQTHIRSVYVCVLWTWIKVKILFCCSLLVLIRVLLLLVSSRFSAHIHFLVSYKYYILCWTFQFKSVINIMRKSTHGFSSLSTQNRIAYVQTNTLNNIHGNSSMWPQTKNRHNSPSLPTKKKL